MIVGLQIDDAFGFTVSNLTFEEYISQRDVIILGKIEEVEFLEPAEEGDQLMDRFKIRILYVFNNGRLRSGIKRGRTIYITAVSGRNRITLSTWEIFDVEDAGIWVFSTASSAAASVLGRYVLRVRITMKPKLPLFRGGSGFMICRMASKTTRNC